MDDQRISEFWRGWFDRGEIPGALKKKRFLRRLPSDPRCKVCGAPYHGVGAPVARLLFNTRPSSLNPRFCSACDDFARQYQGGAEVDMAMLFADLRGSTALSETMTPTEFSRLINRFYVETTRVVMDTDAVVDKLAGDAVAAFWGGYAGDDYVRKSVEAAQGVLRATGHADPGGPWAPVGVGVHAGRAFFGSVGTPDGLSDITAVGEEVNLAARLGAQAAAGEILISERALRAAGLEAMDLEPRTLELKGIGEPVRVRVLRVDQAASN